MVILTNGGDPTARQADSDAYIQQRRPESLEAAQILECKAAVYLDCSKRSLQFGKKLIECIQDILHSLKAESVYAPSYFDLHSDNCALAWSAVEAVRRPEHRYRLEIHEVGNLLTPNRLQDISDHPQRQFESVNYHFQDHWPSIFGSWRNTRLFLSSPYLRVRISRDGK